MAQHAPTTRAGSGTSVSVPTRKTLAALARSVGTSVVCSVVLAAAVLTRSAGTSVSWERISTFAEVRPAVTPDNGLMTAIGEMFVTAGGDHLVYSEL